MNVQFREFVCFHSAVMKTHTEITLFFIDLYLRQKSWTSQDMGRLNPKNMCKTTDKMRTIHVCYWVN